MGEIIGKKPEFIRTENLEIIKDKLNELEDIYEFQRIGDSEKGDDFLLAFELKENSNPIDIIFEFLIDLLEHETGYIKEEYKKIPLEIAFGLVQIEKPLREVKKPLSTLSGIISLLKENLPKRFRDWLKASSKNRLKDTFIVFTNDVFKKLHPHDQILCHEILTTPHPFYSIDLLNAIELGQKKKFLTILGYKDNEIIRNIDWVYEPPFNFSEIKEKLQNENVIVLSGIPEYGKTFTAIRLLWEFYIEGFEPKIISHKESPNRLEGFLEELKPNMIIYFEDPWGQYFYDRNKLLEREIRSIISSFQEYENLYVIITSREDIFTNFKEHSSPFMDYEPLSTSLNLSETCYDIKKRIIILNRYGELFQCEWFKNSKTKKKLELAMESSNYLLTPLSIKIFSILTRNEAELDELINEMKKCSKEVLNIFIKNFEEMERTHKIFLALLFICEYLKLDKFRELFFAVIESLDIEKEAIFENILNKFEKNKILIKESDNIGFSHPLYVECLGEAIFHGSSTFNDIFKNVINEFYEKEIASECFAYILARYPQEFEEDFSLSVIENMFEKKQLPWSAISYLDNNFDKFTKENQTKMLNRMFKEKHYFPLGLYVVGNHYNQIPPNILELCLQGSKNEDNYFDVFDFLKRNYYKFDDQFRDALILSLSKFESNATTLVDFLLKL